MMITVIGSVNMDLVVQTDVFPKQGETVLGQLFTTVPGGKGANQAVAAARLGGNVHMVANVGNDSFGDELLENLLGNSVDISGVTESTRSGYWHCKYIVVGWRQPNHRRAGCEL